MDKNIIMLFISISIFSNKASAAIFDANANLCHKDDIVCKEALQTAANGVDKAGTASLTAVNSVEKSITPSANSVGGILHLFGF